MDCRLWIVDRRLQMDGLCFAVEHPIVHWMRIAELQGAPASCRYEGVSSDAADEGSFAKNIRPFSSHSFTSLFLHLAVGRDGLGAPSNGKTIEKPG